MKIKEIKQTTQSLIIIDNEGNELWYLKVGKGIKLSMATFNDSEYEFNIQWKRCKRGSLSKDFIVWVETLDEIVTYLFNKNLLFIS